MRPKIEALMTFYCTLCMNPRSFILIEEVLIEEGYIYKISSSLNVRTM